MRHLFLSTALATAALIGLPAVLQAADTSTQASAQSGASGGQAQSGGQMQSTAQTQSTAMSMEALRSNLEAAGFTNIEIVDATYLVRAETQDGERVVMFLDPPRQTAAAQTGQQGSGQQAAADQATGQQSGDQQAGGEQPSAAGMLAESYRSFGETGMGSSRTVAGDLTADDLMDKAVVDQGGETIGTVSDLLVDQTDEVRAAVIELDDGEHVAVAIDNLEIEQGAGGQVALDMDRSRLEQQPRYAREGSDWNLTHN